MIRWIASYPKSGSTWVRLFLMAYDCPDEFDMNGRSKNHTLDTAPEPYAALSPVPLDQLTEAEVCLLRGAVLVRIARFAKVKTGGPLYLKTHVCNVVLNGMHWIPPDYTDRSLYILRDPRDVAVSVADHLDKSIDAAIADMASERLTLGRELGGSINAPMMSWSLHVQSWLRKLPYSHMFLRYEDLIAEPDRWFQTLLNFFEIPFDRSRFREAMELTNFDRLRAEEDERGFGAKSGKQARFFREGKTGGWRDVLSADQVARIEADHGAAMKQCGYEMTSDHEIKAA